jgi:hypothetical protein
MPFEMRHDDRTLRSDYIACNINFFEVLFINFNRTVMVTNKATAMIGGAPTTAYSNPWSIAVIK